MKNLFQNRITAAGWRRFLHSRIFRLALLATVVLPVLFKVALPLFVSTASVKTNMEIALSSWTGGRASITGAQTISFWPHPRLTLNNVTIVSAGDAPRLLAKAEAITADFDVLAALRGTPVFYDFRLLAPVFNVERLEDGTLNWRRVGWMTDATEGEPDPRPTRSKEVPIGDVAIENGTLDVIDRPTGDAYRVTDISGIVAWPTPSERIRIELSAVINGEAFDWDFACDEPLSFFSGRRAQIRTTLSAAPMKFAFDGTGSLSASAFFSGQLSFSAPSLSALSRWYRRDGVSATSLGAVSVDAAVTIGRQAIKLDSLALSVGGSTATGVLDVALPANRSPRIGGTLAFDRLDLNTLFSAVSPVPSAPGEIAKTFDTSFLEWLRLDLRLSAQQATLGPVALSDLAAGIMVESGRASFDIGDGRYAGGALSGRIAIAEQWINGGGQLAFSLKDADFAAIASQFGLLGPLPIGRGTLNLDMSTDKPLWATTLSDLSGRIRIAVNDGRLVNFNEAAFETLLAKDAFFNLSDVASGAFSFSTADIEATFKDGVADLSRAEIAGTGKVLSLSGRIPYRTGSLALAGILRAEDDPVVTNPMRFFVGGSWPGAVISPLSVLIRP